MPRKIGTYRPGPTRADAVRAYEGSSSRAEDKRFYASKAWRRLRALVLREEPLCRPCAAEDRLTAAEHVHHIQERKLRPDLALDRGNLEPVCASCHNAKRRHR
jgi:5-methylcytosine-specific restriction protein A